MINRFDAEEIVRILCSLTEPRIGDTIVYTDQGWKFQRGSFLGASDEDPENPDEGSFWFNTSDNTIRTFINGATFMTAALTEL